MNQTTLDVTAASQSTTLTPSAHYVRNVYELAAHLGGDMTQHGQVFYTRNQAIDAMKALEWAIARMEPSCTLAMALAYRDISNEITLPGDLLRVSHATNAQAYEAMKHCQIAYTDTLWTLGAALLPEDDEQA